jgi:membrane-associated protein
MIELDLTDLLLNGLATYGAAMLGIALLLGAVGMPIPGTLLVIAAGALVRQETMDGWTALLAGLLGAVIGDSASYAMGRFGAGWVQRRLKNSAAWQAAQAQFQQRGSLAVYATRFLFTPLAIPTNLIAGSSAYNFGQFFSYDVAGELTWLVLYGGLGYSFGSQWAAISQFVSDSTGYLVTATVVGLAVYYLLRRQCRAYGSDYLPTSILPGW